MPAMLDPQLTHHKHTGHEWPNECVAHGESIHNKWSVEFQSACEEQRFRQVVITSKVLPETHTVCSQMLLSE